MVESRESSDGWVRLRSCRAVVCDLDGTLYLGGRVLPGAREFLESVCASGRGLFYFTNNSSKSRSTYLARLRRLGFPFEDFRLITSTDCALATFEREGVGRRIFVLGNRDFRKELTARGFECVPPRAARRRPLPDAVLLAFDTELTYAKIHAAYDLIMAGVPWFATHADRLCPVGPGRFKPDAGSFIAMFETATGGKRPRVVGKPEPEAVAAIAERAGVRPDQIAFVGDRLYTDVRMAVQNGMLSVLVLSGETRREDLASSPDRPHLVVNGVADLTPIFCGGRGEPTAELERR